MIKYFEFNEEKNCWVNYDGDKSNPEGKNSLLIVLSNGERHLFTEDESVVLHRLYDKICNTDITKFFLSSGKVRHMYLVANIEYIKHYS